MQYDWKGNHKRDLLEAMNCDEFYEKLAHDPLWRLYLSVASSKKGQSVRHVYFVTINPNGEIGQMPAFIKLVHKFIEKKTIKAAIYCFEQRGDVAEGNIGEGYHAHMLVHVDPDHFRDNTRNTFKHVVGSTAPVDAVINIIPVKKQAFLADKIGYMQGKKWGLDKSKKVEGDKSFRAQHSICDLYYKNKSYFNI